MYLGPKSEGDPPLHPTPLIKAFNGEKWGWRHYLVLGTAVISTVVFSYLVYLTVLHEKLPSTRHYRMTRMIESVIEENNNYKNSILVNKEDLYKLKELGSVVMAVIPQGDVYLVILDDGNGKKSEK